MYPPHWCNGWPKGHGFYLFQMEDENFVVVEGRRPYGESSTSGAIEFACVETGEVITDEPLFYAYIPKPGKIKDPDAEFAKKRARRERQRLRNRRMINDAKAYQDYKCLDCKIKVSDPSNLTFDHNYGIKTIDVGSAGSKNFNLWGEIMKCDLVCKKCHRRREDMRDSVSDRNLKLFRERPIFLDNLAFWLNRDWVVKFMNGKIIVHGQWVDMR